MVQSKLQPHGVPDETGKQRYVPLITQVGRSSQYRDDEYELTGLDGYWLWPENSPKPKAGDSYRVWLTTKPKTGSKARPGSVYRDIVRAEPVEGGLIDVSQPGSPDDAPVTPETASEAPQTRASPLAGAEVPAEWRQPIEYWVWRNSSDRLSIETQTALKALADVYGYMLANPGLVDELEITRTLAVIQELAARLGRFTWPERDLLEDTDPLPETSRG